MPLTRRTFLGSSLAALAATTFDSPRLLAQNATPVTAVTNNDWPMYRGGPTHVAATTDPAPQGDLAPLWVFSSGARNASNPVVAGDTLYVSGDDDILWAVDRITGSQRWAVAVGPGAYDTGGHSVPAVVDDTIYTGASSGVIFALDTATGKEQWRFATGDVAISPPLVADGVLYVGSNDGFVYALDATTGKPRWQRETGPIYISSATLGDDRIYIGATDGTFFCLATADGAVQWTSRTGRKMKTAAFQDGIVFAPSYDGRLYAFDAETGAQRWASKDVGGFGETNNPAILGDMVIATISGQGIFAFEAATGTPRWERTDFGGDNSSPVIAGDVVYVSTQGTDLTTLDLASGKTVSSYPLGFYAGAPAISDGTLYIMADNGNAYAFAAAAENTGTPVPLPDPIAGTMPSGAPLSTLPPTHLPTIGTFVRSIESATGPDDPLKGPEGIAFGKDGRMYLVDSLNDRIVVYGSDGSFMTSYGKSGTGDGEFAFQSEDNSSFWGDVAVGDDGRLYVADVFNGRVQVLTADGAHQATTKLENDGLPSGIIVDPTTKRLYVSDINNGRLVIATLDATLQGFAGPSASPLIFGLPFGLALGENGEVLVCELEDSTVARVSSTGAVIDRIGRYGLAAGRFRSPVDVALDDQGNRFIADTGAGHIQVFDQSGNAIGLIGSQGEGDGQFTTPTYLAFGPDGLLYVSDDSANRVLVFSVELSA